MPKDKVLKGQTGSYCGGPVFCVIPADQKRIKILLLKNYGDLLEKNGDLSDGGFSKQMSSVSVLEGNIKLLATADDFKEFIHRNEQL